MFHRSSHPGNVRHREPGRLRAAARSLLPSGVIFSYAMLVSLATAPAAMAEGGTIASATPVTYGQQEFGNTSNGGTGQPGCGSSTGNSYRSWWALSAIAGDEVIVDWETKQTEMNMNLFPLGTTDYTFLDTQPVAASQVGANYKAQLTYTATKTGVLPLEFHSDTACGNTPGPYNFTASVLHAVVLSVPTIASLPLTGTVAVGVRNPDGVALNDPGLSVTFAVETSGASTYTAVGSAPVSNGTATISFTIPSADAGESVTIEATSSGTGYLPGSSSTQTVTVAAPPPPPPPPPPCIVPSLRGRVSLPMAERQIQAAHCSVGRIVYAHSRRMRRGGVIRLEPTARTHWAYGTTIMIVVSLGSFPQHQHRGHHRHRRRRRHK